LFIVPVALAILAFFFNLSQTQINNANNTAQTNISATQTAKQHQNDIQLATDQQQEATLKTYLDDMSDLLLNHNLRTSKPGDEVRQVAKERTLTVLRRLKAGRNKIVLQFLQDAHIIGIQNAVVDLSGADLSGDDLEDVNLGNVDLSGDLLSGANLRGAHLDPANLSGAFLDSANLSGASLEDQSERCFPGLCQSELFFPEGCRPDRCHC
jgi:uncharacterized protein YjbI with pentapeptide repeats